MPKRVQLSRRKGYRKPEGAISVARPSRWGNPYRVGPLMSRQEAVDLYRRDLLTGRLPYGIGRVKAYLRGHDLGCYCPIGEPCHADVLLELANA